MTLYDISVNIKLTRRDIIFKDPIFRYRTIMARPEPPSRLLIRMSDDLREQVSRAANAHNRSLNAEIIARLERSFAIDDETETLGEQVRAMDEILGMHERQIDRLRSDVSRLMEREGLYDPNPD